MKQLVKILFIILLALIAFNLLCAQEFSPISPIGVTFDTTTTCKLGKSELIVSLATGPDGLPRGGYVQSGRQVKKWVARTNHGNPYDESPETGIFGRTSLGQMMLIPYTDFKKNYWNHGFALPFEWAFQSPEILILNGKNMQSPTTSSGSAMYSAIGYNEDGALTIFMTLDQPLSLWEFTDQIMNLYSSCKNVVLLDYTTRYNYIARESESEELLPGKMNIQFAGFAYGITSK